MGAHFRHHVIRDASGRVARAQSSSLPALISILSSIPMATSMEDTNNIENSQALNHSQSLPGGFGNFGMVTPDGLGSPFALRQAPFAPSMYHPSVQNLYGVQTHMPTSAYWEEGGGHAHASTVCLRCVISRSLLTAMCRAQHLPSRGWIRSTSCMLSLRHSRRR